MAALSGRASLARAPRLTESHTLGSPVALGVGRRREICVPVRALHELDDAQFRALLGHEMAHHARRDTIRLAILNILQAVFFFQPLFRLAARELRLAAEELCDDWAAGQLDDRLAVASCLTEVARWVVSSDRRIPVPCIGRGRSQLKRRVRRMLNEQHSFRATSNRWRLMGGLGLLAMASLLAPAVAPGADEIHDGRALEGPASSGEHRQSREHGLRKRREHSPVPPAQADAAVGDGESRATNSIFSANLGHEAIEED
jgi:beta-lactamase regulating signal transducer with metallopeptidase domain